MCSKDRLFTIVAVLTLALGIDAITLDQVRRFTDTAHLPMKPVWDVVIETVARTTDAWKSLPHKDVLPSGIRKIIDEQIRKVIAGTRTS